MVVNLEYLMKILQKGAKLAVLGTDPKPILAGKLGDECLNMLTGRDMNEVVRDVANELALPVVESRAGW
jgi:hypothetical protein